MLKYQNLSIKSNQTSKIIKLCNINKPLPCPTFLSLVAFSFTLSVIASIAVFAFLPYLDRSPVKSMRYKGPLSRIALGLFVISFLGLLAVGGMEVSPLSITAARVCSFLYFGYFLLYFPLFFCARDVPDNSYRPPALAKAENSFSSGWFSVANAHAMLARACS